MQAAAHHAADGVVAAESVVVPAGSAEHGFKRQHIESGFADITLDAGAVGQHQFVAHEREVLAQHGAVASVGFVGPHPLGGPFHEGVGPQAAAGRGLGVAAVVRQAGAPGAGHAAVELVGRDEAQVLVPFEEALLERKLFQGVTVEFVEDEVAEVIAELPVELAEDLSRKVEFADRHLAAHLVVARRQGGVVIGRVAAEAVEVIGLLVGILCGEGEADAGDQETVVVAQGIELRTFQVPGGLRIDGLPRVGIPAFAAEVIDAALDTEPHAHVRVVAQDREAASREAGPGFLRGGRLLREGAQGQCQQDQYRCEAFLHISNCLKSNIICSFCRRSLPLKR